MVPAKEVKAAAYWVEQALRRSEAGPRDVLDWIGETFYPLDYDLRFLHASRKALENIVTRTWNAVSYGMMFPDRRPRSKKAALNPGRCVQKFQQSGLFNEDVTKPSGGLGVNSSQTLPHLVEKQSNLFNCQAIAGQ